MATSSLRIGTALAISLILITGCGGSSSDGPDDPAPDPLSPTLGIGDTTVPANATQAEFSVSLSDPAEQHVSVDYETVDVTAVEGRDYVSATGTLEFAPGDTSQRITVEVLRTDFEAALEFAVELSDNINADLHDGFGIATVTPTELIEEEDFATDWADLGVFAAASQCGECHQASEDAPGVMVYDGVDVSPQTGWQHDVMANGFADPYFQAAVVDETRTTPEIAGPIEDACLTCHSPMARTHAHQTGVGLDPAGDYRLATALQQMPAREAVSCTACHLIIDDGNLGTEASFSGRYSISDSSRLILGPYIGPVTQPMVNNTQYSPAFADHTESSALCATCHTLLTPTIHVDTGQFTGQAFPEQTPYLEWQNSSFGPGAGDPTQCQDCHMAVPAAGYATQIATRPDGTAGPSGWPERSPFPTHTFAGGNTHLLELLKQYRDVLGLEASTSVAGFDAKISDTRLILESQAASITIDTITREGDTLRVPVRITNRSGHKLPTSYPSRRVWIHLRVDNADGVVLFESGRPDPNGRISIDQGHLQTECLEVPKTAVAFDYAGCFEPHHNMIDSPDQVAVYESILGDVNGRITYVLLHAAAYLKDNRIPPAGFSRSFTDYPMIAIQGLAANDADFNTETGGAGSGEDTVHYRVNTAGHAAPFTIEARLLYESVKPGFVYGLHADDDPRVARYKQMYEQVPPLVETIAEASEIY